jgi:glutamate 5-kinase
MSTKIEAAKIATNMGVPVFMVNGLKDGLEIDLSASPQGTYFPAVESIGSKKHWIAYEAKAAGRVIVDDGAKAALAQNTRSLLAPGVMDIEGSFKAGDIVEIADGQGEIFAKGKVRLSSADLLAAKGKKVKGEVVHRDDLVVL